MTTDKMLVELEGPMWKRVLNLLTEELDVWDNESIEHAQVVSMIREIEDQTGFKPRVCVNCGHTFVEHHLYAEPETGASASKCSVKDCECPDYEEAGPKAKAKVEDDGLRRIPKYIRDGAAEDDALLDLQVHLMEFNKRYGRSWSLTAPKRGRRESAVIGKASDNNHLLYQDHVDAILSGVPKPITVDGIRVMLVSLGEKPSTAKLLAPDYMRTIAKVLDPSTKRHRGSAKTLAEWGTV